MQKKVNTMTMNSVYCLSSELFPTRTVGAPQGRSPLTLAPTLALAPIGSLQGWSLTKQNLVS